MLLLAELPVLLGMVETQARQTHLGPVPSLPLVAA